MALGLCQNFVTTQYLENKWAEIDQKIFFYHLHIQDLGWDCYHFSQICNRAMALDWGQNFVSEIENKWTEFDQKNFFYHLHIQDLGWDCYHFSQICNRAMALDWGQNFVSAQYLENKLTEFHQNLNIHQYLQDLGWDC